MAKTKNKGKIKNGNKNKGLHGRNGNLFGNFGRFFERINLLTKGNPMKSATYKRENGKVIEIKSESSNLGNNDAEAVLLAKYEDLFNQIDKGSQVVSFIKTKEYKDSLIDILQNCMVKILSKNEYKTHVNPAYLLKKIFYDRCIDYLRTEQSYSIFKQDNLDLVVENRESGITENYIQQCITEIKNILSVTEYKIFTLYHVNGYTMQEMETKIDMSYGSINSMVNTVNNKIDKLKIAYLYNCRYATYNSQGKKRQHKRKVLTRKEIIELCGMPYKISIELYQSSQVESSKEVIPHNKCLSYGTKQYFKVSSNDTNQIADLGINAGKAEYLIDSNTYGNAKVLPLTSKEVNEHEVIDW